MLISKSNIPPWVFFTYFKRVQMVPNGAKRLISQSPITRSKSTIETVEQEAKYVQMVTAKFGVTVHL